MKPLSRLVVNTCYLSSDAVDSTPVRADQSESITDCLPLKTNEGCIENDTKSFQMPMLSSLPLHNNYCNATNSDMNVHAVENSVDIMHDQTVNQLTNVASACVVDLGAISSGGNKYDSPTNEFVEREAAAAHM